MIEGDGRVLSRRVRERICLYIAEIICVIICVCGRCFVVQFRLLIKGGIRENDYPWKG